MNKNHSKDATEVENVSTRVRNTKKEIQQLKNELEKLFSMGAQLVPAANQETKIREIQKVVSPISKENYSLKKQAPVAQKVEVNTSPTKKNRNYNPAEAREYIKKQKEKRAEQLRAQIHVVDNKVSLKKDKLRELHEKANELVKKNVQLKRERSKSREPATIRLDKTSPRYKSADNLNLKRAPAKSQERQRQGFKSTSGDRLKVPEKARQASKSQERAKIEPTNERISRSRARNKPETVIGQVQEANTIYLRPPKITVNADMDKTVYPTEQTRAKTLKLNERVSRSRSRSKPAETATRPEVQILQPPTNDVLKREKSQERVKLPSKNESSSRTRNKPAETVTSRSDTQKASVKPNKVEEKPQLTEFAIMTDACVKDTKETQTSRTNNFEGVVWMQPPKVSAYPYNFISSVKKKLQQAIYSPITCTDVFNSDVNHTPIEKTKSKEIKEMIIKSVKSDLKSFASHKGPNLDLKEIDNMELVPKKVKSNPVPKNLFEGYDSESDTSKNIPEISSESLGSVDPKPNLSISKLKDLKLMKTAHRSTKSDVNGDSELRENYSSDFQKESNEQSSNIRTIFSEKKTEPATSESSNDDTIKSIKNTASITFKEKDLFKISKDKSSDDTIKSIKNSTSKSSKIIDFFKSSKDKSSGDFKPTAESSVLEVPSMSLTIKTDQDNNGSDTSRVLMKTITLRSADRTRHMKNSESRGSGDDNSQPSFKSLLVGQNSTSSTDTVSEEKKENNVFRSKTASDLSLKEPPVSLVRSKQNRNDTVKSQMKNITVRPGSANNLNEIHLKFEAEVRLLNDFNESFNQFMAAEKAFNNLKSQNETNLSMVKIFQNVDTQTSVVTKTSTNVSTERSKSKNSTINFSRGSEIAEDLDVSLLSTNKSLKSLPNVSFSTDWNLSKLDDSSVTNISVDEGRKSEISISNIENYDVGNCNNIVSLNIFDHLIKDEDTRIQQLKQIIKIRQKALLDRTKIELVWLEIQRKHLIETGKTHEASLLKKKQRGILIKHEQERNEIKKLKQMQKEVSEHRKNTLKQQRNLVKKQLSTNNMLSKITVKKREETRSKGPLRVVQSCNESIHSETSTSLKSSGLEDVFSITSKSVRISESSDLDVSKVFKEEVHVSNAKRSLLMREAALQKRRKTAEELLRWHRKLLDEERKINELEAAATSVVKQASEEHNEKHKFKGKQLQQLWESMTGSDEKKFVEDKVYVMSQVALERLCKTARQYSNKKKAKNGEQSNENSEAKKSSDDVIYSSGFEQESVQEIINSQEEKTQISSISELIDNFSRIEDELSILTKKSEAIDSVKESLERSYQSTERKMTPEEVQTVEDVEETSERTTVSRSSSKDVIGDEQRPVIQEPEEKNQQLPTDSVSQEVTEELISETFSVEDDINTVEDERLSVQKETIHDDVVEHQKTVDELIPSVAEDENTVDEQIPSVVEGEKTVDDQQSSVVVDENTVDKLIPSVVEDEKTFDDQISSDVEVEITVEQTPSVVEDAKTADEQTPSVAENEKKVEQIPSEASTAKSSGDILTSLKDQKTLDHGESSINEDSKLETELTFNKPEEQEDSQQFSTTEKKSSEPTVEDTKQSISETSDKDQHSAVDTVETSEDAVEKTVASSQNLETTVEEHIATTDDKSESVVEDKSAVSTSKKDLSDLEEALESACKIEESLTNLNKKLTSVTLYEKAPGDITPKEIDSEESSSTSKNETSVTESEPKTPTKKDQIDVKKRVSEILADASLSRGDKSPRLQDLYVTAYDVGATNSSESNETTEDGRQLPTDIFGSEAEELWKKQLAIEQEIKQIELQQKEQLPYVFMREIPNKPPPPYTPPSSLSSLPLTILPSDVKEISEVASYSSKVLYKAYQNNNLEKVKFSENGFKLFSKLEVSKACAEFMFNVCRDIVRDYYKQFETVEEPSWMRLTKKPQLVRMKPADASGLERMLSQKLKELFGFKKVQVVESAIIKWGRKKRDHVDEVLVAESQQEESQWTNFEKDELIVKNQLTEDIMKMLIDETAAIFSKILAKKKAAVLVRDKSE